MIKRKKDLLTPPVILIHTEGSELFFEVVFREAKRHGYKVLDSKYTHKSIDSGVNVKGVITSYLEDPIVKKLLKRGCAVVRLGRFPSYRKLQNALEVLPDFEATGRMAADHFADRRFRDVGFIGNYPWREKPYLYNGFHDQAENRGCNCHLLQIKINEASQNKEHRFETKSEQIIEWIKKLSKPTGVLTYNDNNAASILTILQRAGVKVPEEVALLGVNNDSKICNYLPVPLSSIQQNNEEQYRIAVELIHNSIRDGKLPEKKSFLVSPKELVVRQSTNLLAVSEPVVSKAIQFIWNHYQDQLSIEDISRAVGVAPSTLSLKFRKYMNHGVNAELRRKRLEHSKELLRGSRMVIEDIAMESGFPNPSYFFKAFRQKLGMTPAEYRRQHGREIV